MKPELAEVSLAIERMLNYTGWTTVALTKSRYGEKTNFCKYWATTFWQDFVQN